MSLMSYCQKNDSVAIVHLLKDDYKTLLSMDINKHISNCTKDYILVEGADIMNMEDEKKWFANPANKATDRKDYFDFKYVRIDGDFAYAVYNLKSDITKEGKPIQKNWNESAVFRKVNGEWKIALIPPSTSVSVRKFHPDACPHASEQIHQSFIFNPQPWLVSAY